MDDFHPNLQGQHTAPCRDCETARVRAWQRDHPEAAKTADKKWKAAHREEMNALGKLRRDKMATIAGAGPLPADKRCNGCGQTKPLEEFRKSKVIRDGRNTKCRACNQARITAWRDTRREKERESGRARYKADPEKHREYARERYHANKEKAAALNKRWRDAHRDEMIERANRRRMQVQAIPGSHTQAEWKNLCRRFDHRCVRCGAKGPLTRDHIIPVTCMGATDGIDNIQPLCKACNCSKSNRHAVDYRETPFENKGRQVAPPLRPISRSERTQR